MIRSFLFSNLLTKLKNYFWNALKKQSCIEFVGSNSVVIRYSSDIFFHWSNIAVSISFQLARYMRRTEILASRQLLHQFDNL